MQVNIFAVNDGCLDLIHLANAFGRDDMGDLSLSRNPRPVEHKSGIGKHQTKAQIVDTHNNGQATTARNLAQQAKHVNLVPDIQGSFIRTLRRRRQSA